MPAVPALLLGAAGWVGVRGAQGLALKMVLKEEKMSLSEENRRDKKAEGRHQYIKYLFDVQLCLTFLFNVYLQVDPHDGPCHCQDV